MDPILLAKRRTRARVREGGAILFIIAMTLTTLAAVGVYALSTAAGEMRSAGYERQATLTHYVAEYGANSTASLFGNTPGFADLIVSRMLNPSTSDQQAGSSSWQCTVLSDVPAVGSTSQSNACKRIEMSDLVDLWTSVSGTAPPQPSWPNWVTSNFYVEMVDPSYGAPLPGYSSGTCFVTLEVTGVGSTKPSLTSSTSTLDYGYERVRGYLTTGPMVSSNCQ